MSFVQFVLVVTAVPLASGHGTVTQPVMRDNPSVLGGWCPWCQGQQNFCNPNATQRCSPPSPCWGADPGSAVSQDKFPKYKDLIAPDGTPWIGSESDIPVWCPGDVIPIHTYINADHNGVYRWESQLASPGKETEGAFKNFTDWRSVNQDPDTVYYAEDGVTKLAYDHCIKPKTSNETWTPHFAHCRDNTFAKSTLHLPQDMFVGPTVLRWFWYGAMTIDGQRVWGPEHSLFTNCKDVVIGTPEQCTKSRCIGGSLSACIDRCPSEIGPWDGSFNMFIGNDAFCSQCGKFGVSDCSYVCAGGGSSGGGGGCDVAACSSGQYSFGKFGWNITVSRAEAGGQVPYRAFAYLPFCHGKSMSSCLGTDFDFSVAFRTDGIADWGGYVKLLFWTDPGNILGLLPAGAPGAQGNQSYRLVIFPTTDYPNAWQGEAIIKDGEWYDAHVQVSGTIMTVSVAGGKWTKDLGIDFSKDTNGPQLGAYSFDFQGSKHSSDTFSITIGAISGPGGSVKRHDCQYQCLDACDNGVAPAPPPHPTPPSPPVPPSPPSPAPGPHHCCWGSSSCASVTDCHQDPFCSESESNCGGSCSGTWCPAKPPTNFLV